MRWHRLDSCYSSSPNSRLGLGQELQLPSAPPYPCCSFPAALDPCCTPPNLWSVAGKLSFCCSLEYGVWLSLVVPVLVLCCCCGAKLKLCSVPRAAATADLASPRAKVGGRNQGCAGQKWYRGGKLGSRGLRLQEAGTPEAFGGQATVGKLHPLPVACPLMPTPATCLQW